jgi:FkbM family methyltransferase
LLSRITRISELLQLNGALFIADIGAALLAETPVYAPLVLEHPDAHLFSFDGDPRQIAALKARYGSKATVLEHYVGDGEAHTAYVCEETSGMTSLFKPSPRALSFFNGFEDFGRVLRTERVQTARLDSIAAIERIDFLKMDIQGSELSVLQNGTQTLRECLAIQLEVSFVGLYEGQPSFGDIDQWMRAHGYLPHTFVDVKRWSISPVVRNNNFRIPFNQLLEADAVYIKDPLALERYSDVQLKRQVLFADLFFDSPDLAVYCLRELTARGVLNQTALQHYFALLNEPRINTAD